MSRDRTSAALVAGLAAGVVLGLVAGWAVAVATGARPGTRAEGEAEAAEPPVHAPVQGQIVGPGPHEGYVLVVDPGRVLMEVKYDHGWGALGVWLFDGDMNPMRFERPPLLRLLYDEATITLESGALNFDGEEDGGRHFEDDVLLDLPERARFLLEFGDKVYTPPLDHVHLGEEGAEEPGHSHDLR
jgi:hypothetical protein